MTEIRVSLFENPENLRLIADVLLKVADRNEEDFKRASKLSVPPPFDLHADLYSNTDASYGEKSEAPAVPDVETVADQVPSGTDAAGFPWDARIHSSNKKQNADGKWQRRRNISEELVAQVEAELRQPTFVLTGTDPYGHVVTETVALAPPPPPPPAAAAPPPPPPSLPMPSTAAVSPSGVTFGDCVQRVANAVAQNKTTMAAVAEMLAGLGLPGLPALSTRPDLIDTLVVALGV